MSKSRTSKSKTSNVSRSSSESGSTNQSEMKTSEIRDLIDFISKSGLNEVNIETKELKLQVKREPDQKVFKSSPVMAPVAAQVAAPTLPPVPVPAKAEKSADSGRKTVEIKSPMIGTFYRSSTPDTPPFVSVGDKVSK